MAVSGVVETCQALGNLCTVLGRAMSPLRIGDLSTVGGCLNLGGRLWGALFPQWQSFIALNKFIASHLSVVQGRKMDAWQIKVVKKIPHYMCNNKM